MTEKKKLKIAVLGSGSGSNMQAIVDAAEAGEIDAKVALVVSNRPDAGVLQRAARHAIPTAVIDPKAYDDEVRYVEDLTASLDSRGVNFVALAGYLRKIPSPIVARFKNRMLNIHPALLPSFGGKGYYGRRVHEAVIEHGVKWTGVTVPLVDEQYDTGPIVLQEPVKVEPDDTPETLAARVLKTEHKLYPKAIGLFAEGGIRIEGRRVRTS